MIPTVINVSKSGREGLDLLSYDFTKNRRIYLFSEITDAVALETIVQLDYLDNAGNEDITVYINSPGGSVSAGFAIVDAMNRCKCDIVTICTGMAASMGAFILSCGTKGKRFATPLSEIMIHQPLGGAKGQASDIKIHADHILYIRGKMNRMLSEMTNQPLEVIERDTERDNFMSAEQAKEYGLIDKVISKRA